jgi:hypothetical protein
MERSGKGARHKIVATSDFTFFYFSTFRIDGVGGTRATRVLSLTRILID